MWHACATCHATQFILLTGLAYPGDGSIMQLSIITGLALTAVDLMYGSPGCSSDLQEVDIASMQQELLLLVL